MLTIILPCAGEGSRLGLPFPKELAPLGPGRAVIDSALDIIRDCGRPCRVVIVDDGNREPTRRYAEKRLPGVPVAMVKQRGPGLYGAVLGAEPWFDHRNVLMLPDALYGAPRGVLDRLSHLTLTGHAGGFAVAATMLPQEDITQLGALHVTHNRVMTYEEHPPDPAPYNAAWGMLAFTGSGVAGLREIQAHSLTKKAVGYPVIGAPVVWLDSYRDCGTWPNYLNALGSAND